MSELPTVSGEQAVAAFQKFGFAVARTQGSHRIMKKPGHRYNLSVPVHKGKNLKKGTLRSLIEDAGLTVAQFTAAID